MIKLKARVNPMQWPDDPPPFNPVSLLSPVRIYVRPELRVRLLHDCFSGGINDSA